MTHRLWLALFLMYSLLIFYLSSIPIETAPGVSAVSAKIPYSDKIAHVTEYMVYGLIGFRALSPKTRWALFISMAFLSSYALSDEVHQHFVPFRDPDIFDFFADSIGIGIAGLLSLGHFPARKRAQMKAPSSA